MDFFELLANHHLDSQSRWSKVKDKVETDPRYKAVDSSSQREDLFKQYIEKIAKVSREHYHCAVGRLICAEESPRPELLQDYPRMAAWNLDILSLVGCLWDLCACTHTISGRSYASEIPMKSLVVKMAVRLLQLQTAH